MNAIDIIEKHNKKIQRFKKAQSYPIQYLRIFGADIGVAYVKAVGELELYKTINKWNATYRGIWQFWY